MRRNESMDPEQNPMVRPIEDVAHGLTRAALIVNTRSRQGRRAYPEAVRTLKQRFELVASHAVDDPAMTPTLVETAVGAGTPLVIVGGGDGTLSACIAPFLKSESVLGTLPLGTGNQFARDLGIPISVVDACQTLAEGKIATVDIGEINEQPFLTVATIGLTTRIARELTSDSKRKWGRFAYAFALVRALRKTQPFELSLRAGSRSMTCPTLQAVIGNGRFHAGPFPLSPEATLTDGQMVVYALRGVSKWGLVRYALNLPGGNHVYLDEVPTFEARSGEIATRPVQPVTIDGETRLQTPVRFQVRPRALRVIAPQTFIQE